MKKLRNKFSRPRMIWDSALIAEDRAILAEYGLRRKREIWAAKAIVRDFRRRARDLNAIKDKEKEKVLVEKINKLGMLKANSLDDILSLNLKNVLDRRLQTLVFKRGISSTMRQARQLIVHGHVFVAGRRASFPSYLVPLSEEDKINVTIDVGRLKPPLPPKADGAKKGEVAASSEKPAEVAQGGGE